MFPDDISKISVPDEEYVSGEYCESDEEEFWTEMILEKLDSLKLPFASIVMLNTYATKAINLAVVLLFWFSVLHIFHKNCRRQSKLFADYL